MIPFGTEPEPVVFNYNKIHSYNFPQLFVSFFLPSTFQLANSDQVMLSLIHLFCISFDLFLIE